MSESFLEQRLFALSETDRLTVTIAPRAPRAPLVLCIAPRASFAPRALRIQNHP
jgi:hypothetical protein